MAILVAAYRDYTINKGYNSALRFYTWSTVLLFLVEG